MKQRSCLLPICLGLTALLVALAASAPAAAQSCPDPADYDADIPTKFLEWRPTLEMPPPVWPSGDPFDCDLDPPPGWCSDNIALVPKTGEPVREPLLVWFPGLNGAPENNEHLLYTAAYAGYRTLGLAWDSGLNTRASWCDTPAYEGGECDDGCQFATGFEMLTGVENPDTSFIYDAHEMRSVETRLALALQDLYTQDMNDNDTNDHHWDDFCTFDSGETVLHFEDMVLGGFSAGGQMAAFISYVEPVAGLFTIEAGADYCEETDFANNPIGGMFPIEYTEHFAYPPCGGAACDPDKRFVAVHEQGNLNAAALAAFEDNLAEVGFDNDEYDLDNGLASGLPATFPYNVLTTGQASTCSPHASMATNSCLPNPLGTTITNDPDFTDDYYLFPAYLETFCRLEP